MSPYTAEERVRDMFFTIIESRSHMHNFSIYSNNIVEVLQLRNIEILETKEETIFVMAWQQSQHWLNNGITTSHSVSQQNE
jgi:hypothetical protein